MITMTIMHIERERERVSGARRGFVSADDFFNNANAVFVAAFFYCFQA